MDAQRYGIYLRVFTLISNEWAKRTSEISNVNTRRLISISPSVHVLFCLLYKHTNNDVFDDFPKISDHFPKVPRAWRTSPNISEDYRRLPKVAEDFRGRTDDVSIIQHHLWVLFKRLCSYSNGNLKTWDSNLIFSHVKLSYFYMWKYMDFLSGRNPDKTLGRVVQSPIKLTQD